MATSEKDIKKLWGLAAGLCCYPGCGTDCIQFIDDEDPTIIGEMAHVIAQQPGGPRGQPGGGSDDYTNLILLCPTHHRLVDKAPATAFPEALMLQWKADHEKAVRSRLATPLFRSARELAAHVSRILIENHTTWKIYGPESRTAQTNPVSNLVQIWTLRKLSVIIPNNTRISNVLRAHAALLSPEQYALCTEFMEHAAGFEASAYVRRDSVPRFPVKFAEMVRNVSAE